MAAASILVFLSGASALLFETLWLRLCGLVFGNSVWSAALILSSFMSGLALGNGLAAVWRNRRPRPLRIYALLELGVALFGCAIVFVLPHIGAWLRPVFQLLWQQQSLLSALRFALSFLILLIPTTAMGLCLPILIDDLLLRRHHFSRAISILYGCNTLGAVLGAIAGEAWLVRAFGVAGTGLVAGSLNCLAAAVAWLLTTSEAIATAPKNVAAGGEERLAHPQQYANTSIKYASDSRARRLILVSLGSGILFLCLEVVWFRFLRLYLASSSTAFAMMLAVVLSGIALGGIAGSAMRGCARRSAVFGPLVFVITACATLLTYLFFPAPSFSTPGPFFLGRRIEVISLSFFLMFPTACLAGISFPSLVTWMHDEKHDRTASVGIITSSNTMGAAAGPLLASFILLPLLGFQSTLIVGAAGYFVLGVALADRSSWSMRRPAGAALWLLCLGFVALVLSFPYHRDEQHLARSRSYYETGGTVHLVRKVEGTSDTWQLLRNDYLGEPYFNQLLTSSFSMSNTNPHGQRYMRYFAYLPVALLPQASDALLICYGCGVTADALTHCRQLERIDIVDLSKEVLGLAPFYSGPFSSNPLRDPRVHAVVQDGRFFLQASPQRYDLITGEPPPPKVIGSVNLYTEEFFCAMRDRLNDGGMASFWLPIYQLRPDETKAILHAFHNAFAHASVWAGPDNEWIMLGMKEPLHRLTRGEIARFWDEPAMAADLRRIGLEVPQQLAALFLMDSDEVERLSGNTPPLTDQFPKRLGDAQTDVAATASLASVYFDSAAATERFFSSSLAAQVWPETSRAVVQPLFLLRETRYASGQHQTNQFAELDFYLRHTRLRVPVLEALGSNEYRIAIARAVASRGGEVPAEALPDLVADALGARDFARATQQLEVERARSSAKVSDFLLLIYLYCLNGEVDKAEAIAAQASIPRDPLVDWLWAKLGADFGFSLRN